MKDILKEICDRKREHIAQRSAEVSEEKLRNRIAKVEPPRGFRAALERKVQADKFGLIAELKKASPSKSLIRESFNPAELAQAYEKGGTTCLSVLTDEPYFQGKDEYLTAAHAASPLPVLRKDFMLDPYQVLEARALGADCILLIMGALEDDQAKELESVATQLGMDILIEVHDEQELKRALALSSRLVGINNRDLKTLKVDLSTSEHLRPLIPAGYTVVCESGIHTHDDLLRMQQHNIFCFLVGESLMREEDVAAATCKLLGEKP